MASKKEKLNAQAPNTPDPQTPETDQQNAAEQNDNTQSPADEKPDEEGQPDPDIHDGDDKAEEPDTAPDTDEQEDEDHDHAGDEGHDSAADEDEGDLEDEEDEDTANTAARIKEVFEHHPDASEVYVSNDRINIFIDRQYAKLHKKETKHDYLVVTREQAGL